MTNDGSYGSYGSYGSHVDGLCGGGFPAYNAGAMDEIIIKEKQKKKKEKI